MRWHRISVLLFGTALVGCATFKAGAPTGRVDVIAHRGASAYAPENTLAAFRQAIAMKADWFELDCTLSRDGEVVVIHDDTIERTTGGIVGDVSALTAAELRRYDVGSWFGPQFAAERIPTLAEALDVAQGKIGVYIEIKDSADDAALKSGILEELGNAGRLIPGQGPDVLQRIEASGSRNLELTRRVIALVRENGMAQQVVIQSFSPIVCAVALIEAPDLRTELLASSSDSDPLQWNRFFEWNRLIDPHGFNPNKKDVTRTLVSDLHARGKTIAVWTVNDPVEMRELVRLGVDAIITDRPDVALQIAKE